MTPVPAEAERNISIAAADKKENLSFRVYAEKDRIK